MVTPVAQDAADREPVGAGHQHVEHDDVGSELVDAEQPVVPVHRGLYVVALEAQRSRHGIAHMLVVLDDQDAAVFHVREHRTPE